jgi:hypothetical protein
VGEKKLGLESGARVRTFSPPPAKFDFRTASEKELAAFGFPSRPEDARLREMWESTFDGVKFIAPEFAIATPLECQNLPGLNPDGTHPFWAGFEASNGTPVQFCFAVITVPDAIAGPTLPAAMSAWVGITSPTAGTVFQAGIGWEFLAGDKPNFYVWTEFYPYDNVTPRNFAVSPGDTLAILVCAPASDSGFYSFVNTTSGIAFSYAYDAPPGATLQGEFAAWMVERTAIDCQLPALAEFGEVYFDMAMSKDIYGYTLNPGDFPNPTTMEDEQGNVLARAKIENKNLIQVTYTGR